jgi:hypothetical protein
MPFPATGPASRSTVKVLLGVADADNTQDALIDMYVAATNVLVKGLPVAQSANTDPAPADWTNPSLSAVVLGADQLAARLYRRKDSAEGVSAIGSANPVYVLRDDPDLAQLLQVGAYEKPSVG